MMRAGFHPHDAEADCGPECISTDTHGLTDRWETPISTTEQIKEQNDVANGNNAPVIAGVGPDAETVANENGGKQSHVPYRFDLVDAKAMFEMTRVLSEGAEKYGANNWRKIQVTDHLNHLLIHAYAYLAGDESDDHLSHIMCRAMFAQAVEIEEKR